LASRGGATAESAAVVSPAPVEPQRVLPGKPTASAAAAPRRLSAVELTAHRVCAQKGFVLPALTTLCLAVFFAMLSNSFNTLSTYQRTEARWSSWSQEPDPAQRCGAPVVVYKINDVSHRFESPSAMSSRNTSWREGEVLYPPDQPEAG